MRQIVLGISLTVICNALGLALATGASAGDERGPDGRFCIASYISHKFHGCKTASGEIYDKTKLTAAHRKYPLGTRVRVTNVRNGKSVVLRINDRGPFIKGRHLDVSYRAAQELGFVRQGKAKLKVEVLGGDR